MDAEDLLGVEFDATESESVLPDESKSKIKRDETTPQTQIAPLQPQQATDTFGALHLHNCVATVNLSTTLNLNKINSQTRNSEFNPSRFHGLVMRIREPKATALIFSSGKIVCTGAKGEEQAFLASKKFARIIQKLGFPVKFCDFKIQNIVATVDLRFPIRLEGLHQVHGQFSSYEPELFPALIYRMIKPRVVLLVFVNGKVVLTGAKAYDDLREALANIYPILRSFRKH